MFWIERKSVKHSGWEWNMNEFDGEKTTNQKSIVYSRFMEGERDRQREKEVEKYLWE